MSEKLDQKVIAITGAGSGIGRAIALRCAEEGAKVAVLDINDDDGIETKGMIQKEGGIALYYSLDVSNAENVQNVFMNIHKDLGIVDVLINNAGIAHVGTIEQCSEKDLDLIYQVNIKGVYLCARAAIEQMVENEGGVIINMASVASHLGIPDRFAYSMSKGAVLTMTQSIATDYVDDGIRCNSISPARVHTPFVDGFLEKNYPGSEQEMFEKLSKSQPIGRMGQPEEIAGLAVYLASEEASFITGSDFCIDGGFVKIKK